MGITPANSSANGTVSTDRRCFRNLQDDLGFWWKDDGCRSSPLNDNRLCVYEFVASFVSTKETVHQASFIRFVISRFRTLGKHPRLGVLELFNDGTNVNAKAETAPRNAMSVNCSEVKSSIYSANLSQTYLLSPVAPVHSSKVA